MHYCMLVCFTHQMTNTSTFFPSTRAIPQGVCIKEKAATCKFHISALSRKLRHDIPKYRIGGFWEWDNAAIVRERERERLRCWYMLSAPRLWVSSSVQDGSWMGDQTGSMRPSLIKRRIAHWLYFIADVCAAILMPVFRYRNFCVHFCFGGMVVTQNVKIQCSPKHFRVMRHCILRKIGPCWIFPLSHPTLPTNSV